MKKDEFIVGWELGNKKYFFEQDDLTGYLYVGDSNGITHALHIYNRTPEVNIQEKDVSVVLSDDAGRCGVVILGKLRGVLGFNGDAFRPAYTMVGEGVTDPQWSKGFTIIA